MPMLSQDNSNDYDQEPVVYCARCYSLKIRHEDIIDADCCMECGCSDTVTASIGEWEKLYERRYGKKYIERGTDIKKNPVFTLPIRILKEKVFDSPNWKKIIFTLYPHFPKRLDKASAIIYLFDKLTQDNRFDDLRILLIKDIKNRHYGREEVKKS